MTKTDFREDIQALRGVAVIAVVAYHFFPEKFTQGYLGVDTFFVISGYVVTPLIFRIFSNQTRKENLVSLRRFYTRRFYRLAPAMLVTLFLASILIFLFASTSDLKIFGQQVFYTIFLAGNIGAFKLSGDYFHNNGNPLIHTWSLAVEEQIYLGLPLVILAFSLFTLKRFKEKIQLILLSMTGVSLAFYLGVFSSDGIYSNLGIRDTTSFEFYSPLERFWEFGVGGLIWLINEKRTSEYKNRNSLTIRFSSLAFVAVLSFVGFGNEKISTLLVVGCTLIVVDQRIFVDIPRAISKILSWLGDRSYSIYLVHMPVVFLIGRSPYFDFANNFLLFLLKCLSIFFVIVTGHLIFEKVETRFRMHTMEPEVQNRKPRLFIFQSAFLLAFSSFLIVGANSNYYGLQEPLPDIPKAWGMDPNCARMSEWDGPPCIYLARDPVGTILLIGDSHAAQFSDVITQAGRIENWNVVIWTMAGCAVVFVKSTSQTSSDCLFHNLETLKWIQSNSPDLVIVSQYNGNFLPQRDIRKSVETIKQHAGRVHIVGNTPVFFDRRFMTHPALFQGPYKPKSVVSRNEMDERNVSISNDFLNWAKRSGHSASNLNNLWCTSTDCRRRDSGGWYFFDRDHLSVHGASLALSHFRELLRN